MHSVCLFKLPLREPCETPALPALDFTYQPLQPQLMHNLPSLYIYITQKESVYVCLDNEENTSMDVKKRHFLHIIGGTVNHFISQSGGFTKN